MAGESRRGFPQDDVSCYLRDDVIEFSSSLRSCHTCVHINIATTGQSSMTLGRIAAAHGSFNRIRQVAPICAGTSAGFWLGVNAPLPPEAKKILKI